MIGGLAKLLQWLPLIGRALGRAKGAADAVREPPPLGQTLEEWERDETKQRERLDKLRKG